MHVCRECGTTAPRWAGRCAGCGQWNTIDEARATPGAPFATRTLAAQGLGDDTPAPTGVGELDRVLGGGLVAGSTTLLFGEPGAGKSTLALMVLRERALRGDGVALVAAEESPGQVARRARRLGAVPEGLDVLATADLSAAEALVREGRRTLVVVDSVSALSDGALAGGAGSVPQVRHAAERLCAAAKSTDTTLLLVGHVTKDGELAGPRALEHLVDTVVRIEGERQGTLRLLRSVKNRFGATGEVGLLEMSGDGLRELADPASLRGPALGVPGVVAGVTNDGSRSLLVEIQALVAAPAGAPRRVAHQVSAQRLSLLLAVLAARCGIATQDQDVFAASAGGLPATEPGVDLALALAVASAAGGFVVPGSLVALGEVGLAGELRAVAGATRRVREARRLGASVVVAPREGDVDDVDGVRLVRCASLGEALDAARSAPN